MPGSISTKVPLLNEMIAQGKRPAELARLMDARPQEVTRLVDLHHPTKIDTIAAALPRYSSFSFLRTEPSSLQASSKQRLV